MSASIRLIHKLSPHKCSLLQLTAKWCNSIITRLPLKADHTHWLFCSLTLTLTLTTWHAHSDDAPAYCKWINFLCHVIITTKLHTTKLTNIQTDAAKRITTPLRCKDVHHTKLAHCGNDIEQTYHRGWGGKFIIHVGSNQMNCFVCLAVHSVQKIRQHFTSNRWQTLALSTRKDYY